jgi:hypothetical protein
MPIAQRRTPVQDGQMQMSTRIPSPNEQVASSIGITAAAAAAAAVLLAAPLPSPAPSSVSASRAHDTPACSLSAHAQHGNMKVR